MIEKQPDIPGVIGYNGFQAYHAGALERGFGEDDAEYIARLKRNCMTMTTNRDDWAAYATGLGDALRGTLAVSAAFIVITTIVVLSIWP